MKRHLVQGLSGLIFSSADPNRLAAYYRDILGLPLALNSHGGFKAHWECDFDHVHFAVIQQGLGTGQQVPVVPSFRVANIEQFTAFHKLTLSYPVLTLGEGAAVGEIVDVDGNPVRLWAHKSTI